MIELSIVIPTYNRVNHLQICLEALNRQTQAADDFEVLVVVDGSTDATIERLKSFETSYLLRTIWQENHGQAHALNRGITEAKGRYILFLDDDIVADPRLVAEHLRAHHDHLNAVVVARIIHNQELNVGIRLLQHGLNSLPHKSPLIVAEAYHSYEGELHHMSFL